MDAWLAAGRGRRRAVLAIALLAHVALVSVMLRTRLSRDKPLDAATLTTILLPAPSTQARREVVRSTKLAPVRLAVPDIRLIAAPSATAPPVARAFSAPEPPASAASQPLNLALDRGQLRAIIAGSKPTLAQALARGSAPSALSQIGGDDSYSEKALKGGETEVHSHGGCFKMVPTLAAKADPFNHGGALPGNCN